MHPATAKAVISGNRIGSLRAERFIAGDVRKPALRQLVAAADDPLNHLLVHCHAGISRSTASMTILLAEARPDADEDSLFAHIREIRSQAWPNSRMIGLADDVLGRDGRLVAALGRHYSAQMRLRPDLAEMIGRSGRQQEVEMAS